MRPSVLSRFLLAALPAVALHAIASGQSINLSIGTGAGAPGGSVTLPISLTSIDGAQAGGLQWSFSYSTDITAVTVAAGDAAKASQKSVSCSGKKCVIYGINKTVLGNGTVALATFQIAVKPSGKNIVIEMTEVVAATVGGTRIPAQGRSGSISVSVPPPPARLEN